MKSKKKTIYSSTTQLPIQNNPLAGLRNCVLPLLLLSYGAAHAAGEDEFNNELTFSSGFFFDEPKIGEDRPQISSLELESEIYLDLAERANFTARPFFRYEHLSSDNRHLDLREFELRYSSDSWEFRAGVGLEFWGVTESRHLVDTINQSDFAADFTGDTKLGQPLVQLSWFTNSGDYSFYYLPFFREPDYASPDSRPRLPFVINEDLTTFESDQEEHNPDFAIRWSGNLSIWDIGLHYFKGTQRRPLLTATDNGIASRFRIIEQVGLDAQATIDALLAKLEIIQQFGNEIENHTEFVAGFEYSLSQIWNSDADLGLLSEVLYDSRQENADHLFQKDLMVGARVALNDPSSTELLFTIIGDLDNSGKIIKLEFDRRIGNNFTIGIEGRWWRDTDDDVTLNTLSTENNVRLDLNWFF